MKNAIEKFIDAAAVVDDASKYVGFGLSKDAMAMKDALLRLREAREAAKAAMEANAVDPQFVKVARAVVTERDSLVAMIPFSLSMAINALEAELPDDDEAEPDATEAEPAKPATRWLSRKRIDQFLSHVGRDLETYTTELLDDYDAAKADREESAKPAKPTGDATGWTIERIGDTWRICRGGIVRGKYGSSGSMASHFVFALQEIDSLKAAAPTDAQHAAAIGEIVEILQDVRGDSQYDIAFTIYASGFTTLTKDTKLVLSHCKREIPKCLAELRELAKPKPRTVAETWEDFKAGKLATAKEHDQFRAWMAQQEPMVRKVFRLYKESGDATAKELLDAWMAENGNVPIETQDKEN